MERMRRLLAIRAVNDLCTPVIEWASVNSKC